MAVESAQILDLDLPAHSDLRTKQFYAVKLLSTSDLDVVSDDADQPIGVLQNKPNTGQAASYRNLGVTKMNVDGNAGAIAFGDPIGINDSGQGIKTTTSDAPLIGYARGASTAAGDIIAVELHIGPYRAPAT